MTGEEPSGDEGWRDILDQLRLMVALETEFEIEDSPCLSVNHLEIFTRIVYPVFRFIKNDSLRRILRITSKIL